MSICAEGNADTDCKGNSSGAALNRGLQDNTKYGAVGARKKKEYPKKNLDILIGENHQPGVKHNGDQYMTPNHQRERDD